MKKIKIGILLSIMLLIAPVMQCYGEAISVVPIGKAAGIQLYTDGLLVIGMSEVNGHNAAKDAGIRVNDRIMSVNGATVENSEEFSKCVNENPEGIELEIARDNRLVTVNAVPALSEDDIYRLGLWVRDSCAGIGTITFYNPETNSFAALGHAINDVDTGNRLTLKSGSITDCDIMSVTKSSRGAPGEINASVGSIKIGDVTLNSPAGLFGNVSDASLFDGFESVPVAAKEQVCTGDAYILSDILGNNTERYTIKINKITDDADKGMVIEITDERLLNVTGGIVQGMSGSPIIQNGQLAGAVTHVFVNNPSKGYGILAERMLDANCMTN